MQLTKRQLLGGVAAATASLAMFGAAHAAVEMPKSDGDVDMAAVLDAWRAAGNGVSARKMPRSRSSNICR